MSAASLLGAFALSAGVAEGQEVDRIGFDATGPDAPPLDGSGPVSLWSASPMDRGELRFGALAELGVGLLELVGPEGSEPVLPFAGGLSLSAAWAPAARVGIGVSASFWPIGRGPGLGDLRVHAPLGLTRSLTFTPWVALPTGSARRGVGSGTLAAGGMFAGAVPVGPARLQGQLGASWRPSRAVDLAPGQRVGGPAVEGGAAVGLPDLPGGTELWAELRGAWSPGAGVEGAAPDGRVFAEALGSARIPAGPLGIVVGAGAGLGSGLGNADARAFVGIAGRVGPEVEVTPEPVRGVTAPTRVVEVVGDGAPLPGAILTLDGVEVGRAGPDGRLGIEVDRAEKPRGTLGAQAFGYAEATAPWSREGITRIALVAVPQPVAVTVTDPRGVALPALLQARSDGRDPVEATPGSLVLAPGRWTIDVTHPGFGPQRRSVAVAVGVEPEAPTVVLTPEAGLERLRHTVVDADGLPVPGAFVLLDGLPVGGTDFEGAVDVRGLAAGPHEVLVQHPDYTEASVTVELSGGSTEARTVLARVPGTVRVIAVDVDGRPVPDAQIRFAGPRRIGPLPLGSGGERAQVLGEGSWQILVSSPRFGVQQRDVFVPEGSTARIDVTFVLQAPESGTATLSLRVLDPEGEPVDGARIALDGVELGAVSTGGTLVLEGLDAGARVVEVRAPRHRLAAPAELMLGDGLHEHVVVLGWLPGTVRVRAWDAEGPLEDASVRFLGPASIPATALGPTGVGWFELGPGEWSGLVTSPSAGAQQRDLSIAPESDRLHVVDVGFGDLDEGLGNLALTVVDPDGAPVRGARVSLDGVPLGATGDGGLRVEGLAVGRRTLEVFAAPFRPYTASVRLLEGDVTREAQLVWGPGAVRVRVSDGDGRPAPDALVRWLGPASIPPAPVDASGERLFALPPGRWDVLAISPTLGSAQLTTEVFADGDGLTVLDLAIRPVSAGFGELVLRVVDERGAPIADARVRAGGIERGVTGPGGVLRLEELTPGPLGLTVQAPAHASAALDLQIAPGTQVRYATLAANPGRLTVTVRGPGGRPVDAELTLIGPGELAPTRIGADGEGTFDLLPGPWTVMASAPGLAAGRARAELLAGGSASVALTLTPSQVEIGASALVIRDVVLFDFDAATLRPGASAALDELANTLLAAQAGARVEVRGHSDAVGDLAYNLALSRRRADAVRAALITRGVPAESLLARGYGAGQPVADNETEAGRAANRRVEFAILDPAAR